jgi:hypothetical protein
LETYQWQCVKGFVDRFNEHRAQQINPSDRLCVHEWMARWYGKGGYWINHGLPQYVAIDRKPAEAACEIQNTACGLSEIMLRLKLIETAELESAPAEVDADTGLLYGTQVR